MDAAGFSAADGVFWRGRIVTTAFTPEQDSRIRSMRAQRVSARRMGEILGISRHLIADRITEMDNILAVGTATPSQAHLPAMRRCLCCNRQFKSAHAGNRICGPCLQRDRESGLPASIQQASV